MFIAAILKPEGSTHRIIKSLLTVTNIYAPHVLLDETMKHLSELATRKNVPLKNSGM